MRVDPTPVLRRYGLHARILWRAAPGASVVCLALTAASAAANTVGLVTTGRLVGALPAAVRDGVGSAAADTVWRWLIATVVVFVIGPLCTAALGGAAQVVSARYLATVFDLTMEVGTDPYGVSHLEDPKLSGRIDALVQAMRDGMFVTGVEATWEVLGIRLSGVGAFVILAWWRWWAPLVAVAGFLVLNRSVGTWINTVFDDLLKATGNDRRRATYLRSLLTGSTAGKEIRLFGMGGWLIERYVATWRATMTVVWANRVRGLRSVLWAALLGLATNGLVFVVLAHDVWVGVVSLGSLVTLVQAVLGMESFGPIGDAQSAMARNTAATTELVRLRATQGLAGLDPRSVTAGAVTAASPSQPPRPAGPAAVELRDATFTYPSRRQPVFTGLTLQIPAGQSVAVVGANGAGKSTLIKLLCGLYRPDRGQVRIDGDDPAVEEAARRRVAVIFQDFVRYQLPLADNIGFGALSRRGDPDVLARALADAGGTDLVDRLDRGWETVLSPEYAGGTDLSGGQWQRVALARALAALSAGAGVLVLDEPTAALDVRAEAALFDRFLDVTRGVTTVLVSHRLSSVRHADRIVVIGDAGDGTTRVVEDGTHADLLAGGGVYAHMFTLQATRFTAAGPPAGVQSR
jgi:ATP-binding cassette subfamily B protein